MSDIIHLPQSHSDSAFKRIVEGTQEKVSYPKDSSVLLWVNRESEDYAEHWHNAVEIIMPVDGSYHVTARRHPYLLNTGDILIIPAGELHSLAAPSEGVRLIILFELSPLSEMHNFPNLLLLLSFPLFFAACEEDTLYITLKNQMLAIYSEYTSGNAFSEFKIYASILELCAELGRKNIVSSILPFELGKNLIEGRFSDKTIHEIARACVEMGKVKTGALIVVEQNDSLTEYERTGIDVDGIVTSQLLINIFEHNTPLHDGAVIVRGNRITSATCYLPLSDNMGLSKELGTRHRAGVGISEATDSLTIIVSEETGKISVIPLIVLEKGNIEPMVETAGGHTIMLKIDGTVWAYGTNKSGELGIGNKENKDEPCAQHLERRMFLRPGALYAVNDPKRIFREQTRKLGYPHTCHRYFAECPQGRSRRYL